DGRPERILGLLLLAVQFLRRGQQTARLVIPGRQIDGLLRVAFGLDVEHPVVGDVCDLDVGQSEIDPRRIREPLHDGDQPLTWVRPWPILHSTDNKFRYESPAEAQPYGSNRQNGREPLIKIVDSYS